MRFFKALKLFPLNRCWRFGGDIVYHAVNAGNLIHNTAADLRQHLIGNPRPIAGHTVYAGNGTDRNGVVVGTPVAHNTHAADVRQNGEVLPDLAIQPGTGNLFSEDCIRLPDDKELVLRDLTEATDRKARAGERLTVDDMLRQASSRPT